MDNESYKIAINNDAKIMEIRKKTKSHVYMN